MIPRECLHAWPALWSAAPRPDWDFLAHPPHSLPSDMSFPSGHTTFIAVTVAVSLIATYRGLDPSRSRSPVSWRGLSIIAAVGCVAIALIVTTVMARGVHFPSDAAGAIIFSFTLAPLVWKLWEKLGFHLLLRGRSQHLRG
ncbi:phosphatase PAP2 family protein [Corynebacterium sp. UMB4614]|uniref:phosphatase PAP2 family protein n=1 Tax=Corynebacterium sp. UMB4614 TaxID=3046334 RepID=UPI00254C5507|nr:phosphatase PAP2 family protein [Corynebacterium sp. UMB4614]MDK7134728.1 phosphatase PAP2 family protein [Corynebacterium sp. UMB4614]